MSQKILVTLLQSFGDICLGSCLARNIKLRYPDSHLTFCTDLAFVNILQNNPSIDTILPSKAGDPIFDPWVKAKWEKYDIKYFPFMQNHHDTLWHHDPELAHLHLVDFYAQRCDNLELKDRRTFIYPDAKDQEEVDAVMSQFPALRDKIPVSMHIQSPVVSKSWGGKNFSRLARVLEQQNCVVVQIGGASDEKINTPGVIDLRGKFTPRQSAAAIKKTLMYVGIDSGPAYLADATEVPSVILYGATTPIQAGPLSKLSTPIEPMRRQEFPCGPGPMTCSTHCMLGQGHECIMTLDFDEVSQTVLTKLAGIVAKQLEPVATA